MSTVGFLGAGNMGSALARAAAASGACRVMIADKDTDRARTVACRIGGEAADIRKTASEADIIFLGMKPAGVGAAIEEIRDIVRDKTLIVSMAAAVDIKTVESYLARSLPVIRIMPSTPVAIGEGVILYSPNEDAEGYVDEFLAIMKGAGALLRIEESKIDAAACISGCGPAFAYMFIDALAAGGVLRGLSREQALEYAAKTVRGAAAMIIESGKTPSELVAAVCSPGGTTVEGVQVLKAAKFPENVMGAVSAAYEKTLIMKSKQGCK